MLITPRSKVLCASPLPLSIHRALSTDFPHSRGSYAAHMQLLVRRTVTYRYMQLLVRRTIVSASRRSPSAVSRARRGRMSSHSCNGGNGCNAVE